MGKLYAIVFKDEYSLDHQIFETEGVNLLSRPYRDYNNRDLMKRTERFRDGTIFGDDETNRGVHVSEITLTDRNIRMFPWMK